MNMLKRFLSVLGPGFITGASDDDPSGIATYAQAGAKFGYGQLWTALFSFPFMSVIQEICGRVGLVTGIGLAGVIKKHYSKKILYLAVVILFIANTVNIGADLGAMASSGELMLHIPYWFWLLIMIGVTLFLEVFIPYPTYAKFLKYLAFSLFAYVLVAFVVRQDWHKVLTSTVIPSIKFNKDYILSVVAILGTTISPYLFFWQSDEEVEEEIEHHKLRAMGKGVPHITPKDIENMRLDTIVGMFFSNLVMFFIIITSASTIAQAGIHSIDTADQAALALKPIAGNFAFILFATGIIGTGLLAIPILAGSASYAIAEAFDWKAGLSKSFTQAHGFYMVIAIATCIGFFINFTSVKPFQMLYLAAILNGICAPPLLMLIMRVSNDKKIMKEHVNSAFSNILGWTITSVMTVASGVLLFSLFY